MMSTVKRILKVAILAALSAWVAGNASAECGIASYYTMGHTTANGEAYNHRSISAAHKTLPFGTRVQVTNRNTGRSIIVRINDRGPFIRGRIIDLSSGAKAALGMGGLAPVCLNVVSYGNNARVRSVSQKTRSVRMAAYRKGRSVRFASNRRGKSARYALRRKSRYAKRYSKRRQLAGVRKNRRDAFVARPRRLRG